MNYSRNPIHFWSSIDVNAATCYPRTMTIRQHAHYLIIIMAVAISACSSQSLQKATPTANEDPDPCAARPDGELSILALGDSYTVGQGVPEAERWVVQLADSLRSRGFGISDPEIIARTGWTTHDLAAAIEARDLPPDFQLVTLLIGVNNQFRGWSASEYADDFASLLDQSIVLAGGETNRVIVLSIPDWGATPFGSSYDPARISEEIDRFNAINHRIAETAGVAYVDVTLSSREAAGNALLVAEDGLHPSGLMYAEWAELALPAACTALSLD